MNTIIVTTESQLTELITKSVNLEFRRVLLEFKATQQSTQPATAIYINIEEFAICECCGAKYAKKTWNQRFCCSDCRVKSWEQIHGAKIKFGKK